MAGTAFVFNTLLDQEDRIFDAVAGDLEAAHEAGCRRAARIFQLTVAGPVDAVITSPGGAPYDGDFIQAMKAVFNVQDVVKPGGAILCAAQCPEGMRKSFGRWTELPAGDALERAARRDYDLAAHNVLKLRALQQQVRIALWSALPPAEVRALGIEPVASLEEGVAWLNQGAPPGCSAAVVPCANVIHATVAPAHAGRTS